MAPFSFQSQNKPRSIGSNLASISPMSPEVIALICSSGLIFLVFLSSAIVLIHRRLCHRTQSTTQAEAQVQVPVPLASESKEKVEDVFSPASSSSTSLAAEPLLPPTTTPRSASMAMTEDLIEKLVSKTSAALSKDDKYTTLPLRRSRQARRSRIEQKNPIFDLSMSLATLDSKIISSETSSLPARRFSHQSSSMTFVSLTSGTDASSSTNIPSRSVIPTPPKSMPPGSGDQSAIRPSPTIMSMEARPLETDAAALSDGGTMFVSGSIPSLSSLSSAISLPSLCHLAADAHTTNEAEASKPSYTSLECKTPRQREHRTYTYTEKRAFGTPFSSSTSVSTILTAHDTTFSSDADSEVGTGEVPIKALELGDALSLPASMFNLSFNLSSSQGDDTIGLHRSPKPGVLSLTKYSSDTKFEHGYLTTAAFADTSF